MSNKLPELSQVDREVLAPNGFVVFMSTFSAWISSIFGGRKDGFTQYQDMDLPKDKLPRGN